MTPSTHTLNPAGIARAVERMEMQACSCDAIAEPHHKRDCGPMYHAMSWHARTVHKVATVAEANAAYPPFDRSVEHDDDHCSVCGVAR